MFLSLPRLRIALSVIIAQIVGFVWYSFLFSKAYQQEMKLEQVSDAEAKTQMPRLMIMETLSRLLYFIGLGIVLTFSPGISIWTAGVAYFLAVLSTECSGVIWSDHSWRLVAIRGGKVLADTVVAIVLYGMLV